MTTSSTRREMMTGALALTLIGFAGRVHANQPVTGPLTQGALLRGQSIPGATVTLDGRKLRVAGDGSYVFGVAWDRKTPVALTIRGGGDAQSFSLPIEQRNYKVQKINQLPGKYVTPDPSVAARIKRDNQLIGAARAHDTDELWFAGAFDWPVKGPITGVYGSRRILNGEERQPHFGIDIAAAEGVPVLAAQSGIVRMSDPDLYYTGGTMIIDHGFGVSTSYLHMSRLDVEVGDKVEKGQTIGAIGKTGRATGPHMCWRLNWFKERLDASLIVPPMRT